MRDRVADYAAMGVPNIWLFDPERREVWTCTGESMIKVTGEILTASDTEIAVPLTFAASELASMFLFSRAAPGSTYISTSLNDFHLQEHVFESLCATTEVDRAWRAQFTILPRNNLGIKSRTQIQWARQRSMVWLHQHE
jgi:hypothetical protein